MQNSTIFENILTKLNLGTFTTRPKRVSGGYMHKMYKLETTTGAYAIKLLNPAIMKRPTAMDNYRRAERLESVLEENELPIVPALTFNNRKMQCIDGQYYYLFQWVEGKALDWNEIKKGHCEIAGTLLAKIHKLEQVEGTSTDNGFDIDWDTYIALADDKCPEFSEELQTNRDLLYLAQQEYNSAMHNVPAISCICDGDMDSKNVLWIDGELNIDLKSLYGIGFSWLDWLEYNVKRALMIECENEEERQLGIGQVHETLTRIVYYASVKKDLLKNLER